VDYEDKENKPDVLKDGEGEGGKEPTVATEGALLREEEPQEETPAEPGVEAAEVPVEGIGTEGEAPTVDAGTAGQKKGKAFFSVLFEYLQAIVMAFLIAIVIMAFIGRSYMVEGASMENTLFNSERVLVEKLSYYFAKPERGDIVVLMNPRQEKYGNWFLDTFGFVKDIFVSDMSTRPYIKRVIGKAGDKVEIKGGRTYLNDELLEEPYVSEEIWWDYGPYYVPEGYVFVMGDNRNHSDDSRSSVGFLKIDRILGKAVARFWPLNKLSIFTQPDIFKSM